VIEPRYILAGPFKKGQALVSIGKNSSGIIDKEGNPVESSQIATPPAPIPPPIPPLYSLASAEEKRRFYGQYYAHHVESEAFFFSGSLACVRIGNKYGFMDKTGAIVIPLKYEKAYPFSEGLAAVSINGQWGFIDTKREEIIAPQFEFAENFSEGLAAVEKNGKWGYIDRKGKLLIDPIFRSAGSFENGLARVFTQDSSGLIDQKGKQIALEDYSDCEISKTDGYGITKEESERGELGVEEGIEGGVVGGVLEGVVGDVLGDVVGDVEAPVRAAGEIRPPKLLKSVAPDYPKAAREAGIEGVVILEATTDIYGRVVSCKVLKSIPILDQAAIDAVRQWVYEPLIIHNKPRGVKFTVTVRFTLK
jgi:TonB family protein